MSSESSEGGQKYRCLRPGERPLVPDEFDQSTAQGAELAASGGEPEWGMVMERLHAVESLRAYKGVVTSAAKVETENGHLRDQNCGGHNFELLKLLNRVESIGPQDVNAIVFGETRPGEQYQREFGVRLDERQRERERVARELHDSLLQGLLGVSLQLQAAVGQIAADSPAKTSLDHVMKRMQNVLEEARHILLGLRRPAMESVTLEQAFSCMREEFAPDGRVQFRVSVTGERTPLSAAIQGQVYLIGREALINALRHSEATDIEVEVEYHPQWLRVTIRDNGRGIDPDTVRSGRHSHWGLAGMRERAAGIGAEIRIWSRLAAGTEVEIFWLQPAGTGPSV